MTLEKAVRYDLGEDARARLREKLKIWRSPVLTAAIEEHFDLSEGQIFAFLPKDLSADDLTVKALNRICYERHYDMRLPLFGILQEHLKQDDAVVIVPDALFTYQEFVSWNEDWLPPLLLGLDTQAYHAWTFYTEDEYEFEGMLGMTADWQHIAFLTYASELRGRIGKLEVEAPELLLEELTVKTQMIILSTFDGEGYLVWQR